VSLYRANLFTPDGRLRGSYVYMLLCQVQGPIFIKVGRSCDPFSRLDELCQESPVVPLAMAVAEVHSHRQAARVEADLRHALWLWHSHFEWYVVYPFEKSAFNAAWKPVMAAHSAPSRKIEWNHYSVSQLIEQARKSARLTRSRFMARGIANQDFAK